MSTKSLTHERVYPEDPTFSLRFLALAKNESVSHQRHFFINRKQDRFTLSARYAETGSTPKGKTWVRWRTLFTFSITYRQPANSKFPNINLFYTGPIFGKRIQGVINVTRNPSIVLKGLPLALLNTIYDELTSLLERNDKVVPFRKLEDMKENEVFDEIYDLLQDISYPLFRGSKIEQLTEKPPSFLTALFRSPSLEDVCEYFKVHVKSDLGSYLNENFRHLNPNSLFMLEASQGILSAEERLELIKIHESRSYSDSLHRGEHFNYWENSGSEIPALRGIFRRTKNKDVISMLGSDYNNLLELNDSLKEWRKNSKILSASSFRECLSEITTFESLSKVMHEEILIRKENSPSVSIEEIKNQIKDFCDPEFFPWEEAKQWGSDSINAKIGNYKAAGLTREPVDQKKSSIYSEMYVIHNPTAIPIDKKSVIWNLLKTSDFASLSLSTKAAPLFLTEKTHYRKEDILLSSVAYSSFLKNLKAYACADLAKNELEVSQKNISLYISALFIFTRSYQLKKYKGVIPRKFFTLVRGGVAPSMALLFLKQNVSVKNAIALKDAPEKWINKAIGISDNSFDFF